MHARVTFIEAAAESVASLEHADAPFAADAPFLILAEPPLPFGAFDAAHFGCQDRERRPVRLPSSAPPFRWRRRKIRRRQPPRAAPRRAAADAVQSPGPARPSPPAVCHTPGRRR